jgi:methyl-accepting chemotaxis protein
MTLFPRISVRWQIFVGCLILSIGILAASLVHTEHVARKSAARTGVQMKSVYSRFDAYQRSVAAGMAGAVDAWATSPRLQEALGRGDDQAARPIVQEVQEGLQRSLRPDFVLLIDRHGDVTRSADAPIDGADAASMRLFADLRQGMSLDDALLEHKRRAWQITAAPVKRGSEVVGAIVLGRKLERLFAEFKQSSDDDPKKQVELALVHNGETTAASAHADDWDDIARATRLEARELRDEGGEKISVLVLPDGDHEFFGAQVNGYDGPAVGSIGSIFVMRNRVEKEEQLQQLVHDSLVVGLVALALAALTSFILSLLVARPIRQFTDATRDLAHGEGDLTKRIDVDKCGGATETAELAENLNAMFGNLHKLASEVQGASLQVGASSAQISAASKQMLGGASDQAQKIESSTAAVTELSSSIQQVAENAVQATRVAKTSGESLTHGIQKLGQTAVLIEETAQKIQALGQSGRRIGNIVEVIRQISEQTSLLALNASIEAAHAGEQGRGFAVVADEVSSLARRVGQSAKDIEGLIATISEQTAEAVSSMQNATRSFGEHTSGAAAMQTALQQIVDVVQDTARSVQEQAVVSDEIARNMDAVQKIAHEVLGSSKEAVTQGEELHALALRLDQLVSCFRIDDEDRGPRLVASTSAPALPERASDRRKVARR